MKMNRFLAIVSAGFLSTMLVACGGGSTASTGSGGTPVDPNAFTVSSTVVSDKGTLPLEHACTKDGGSAIPPSFYWKNVPKNTGSYILSIENIGAGDQTYKVPAVYRNLINVDGGVLTVPASPDLTGLGANVVEGATWNEKGLQGGIPCRYIKVLTTPYPVQHFRVTIVALSDTMPKSVATSFAQLDTVTDSSLFGGKAVGLLDEVVVDGGSSGKSTYVRDYVVGRASMTFDY